MRTAALLIPVAFALWLIFAGVTGMGVGVFTRETDLRSDSFTGQELQACLAARQVTHGRPRHFEFGRQHRVLVDWEGQSACRVYRGEEITLQWPRALTTG